MIRVVGPPNQGGGLGVKGLTLVDPNREQTQCRTFVIVGTGWEVQNHVLEHTVFCASVQFANGVVVHVFEVVG